MGERGWERRENLVKELNPRLGSRALMRNLMLTE